jgi:hypothetical protein
VAFDFMQPTLMVFHRPLALFLAWNDETGEIMYMNSDKLDWAWRPLEFVGMTIIETCDNPGDAATTMSALVTRIEGGAFVVIGRVSGGVGRDIRRWNGTEWDDPLEEPPNGGENSFERWRDRCVALGGLSQSEIAQLIESL